MTTHPHLAKLPLTLLCGVLLAGTVSAQAASSTAQTASPTAQAAGGQDALKCYRDANVSFLYPQSWINALPEFPSNPKTDVFLENDKTIFKSADLTTVTNTLKADQILLAVSAGPSAIKIIGKYNASDSALTMLTAMIKVNPDTKDTNKYETPETINLISASDAAQVVLHNGTNYDGLEILLALPDHPVLVYALVASGQVPVYQSIIQGVASTVQAGVDFTKITSPDMLCETFTNKALTVRYPSGWVAFEATNPPATVSLTSGENVVSLPMSSGQFRVAVVTGSQVYSMVGATPSSVLSPSDLISKLKAQPIDGLTALDKIEQPVAVTIGGQPGAEAAFIAQGTVGVGYVIAFYQNKQPVVLVGLTANADAPANRALFEQIAASVTLNSP